MFIRGSLFACLFFYDVYIHYIKIFLFMSFFHYERFYDFFLDLKFDIFSLECMKTIRSWFCLNSRGKNFKVQIKKNRWKFTFIPIIFYSTYYFDKRHDMKQCTTFKNHFLKNTCNLGHSKLFMDYEIGPFENSQRFINIRFIHG